MASRSARESEAHVMEMADPSLEVKRFPAEKSSVSVEESINSVSLHHSWEPLSPRVSPPTPSSSGMPVDSDNTETRPLLSRHARQIEERRQGKPVSRERVG